MIHTAVKERTVVAHEDEAFFCAEVIPKKRAAFHIKVVRGFVNEQEIVFPQEQCCKKCPRALPGAQGFKRAVEELHIHAHAPKLPQELPFRRAFGRLRKHVNRVAGRTRHGKWEIGEAHGSADGTFIFIFAEKQV